MEPGFLELYRTGELERRVLVLADPRRAPHVHRRGEAGDALGAEQRRPHEGGARDPGVRDQIAAQDLVPHGRARPGQLLPTVSREVLRVGPDVAALRDAAERMRDAVAYLA